MTRSSLPHQIVFLVFAVLVAVLAVLWISLYSVREAMNQDAAEESKRRMQGRLVTLQDEVSLIASDYHNWTDVYLNAWDLDLDRLASNYGITAERGDVFQFAEMFDGPFEAAISWRAGMGLMPQAGFLDQATKDVLRQHVRSLDISQRQTHNYFEFQNGTIIAFSSSYLLPESDELMEGLDPQEQAIAVIGRILSVERLDKIAQEFAMQNLRVSDQMLSGFAAVQIAVMDVHGQPAAWLQWQPPTPGTVLFWKMVPIMAVVSLIFVIASYWGARVLRDKANTLVAREAASFDQARTDVLTGLPNRFALREHLDAITQKKGADCAVLALDLDRFKQINDTVGHIGGDVFLETFGERLGSLADDTTFVARLGGDEFVLVMSSGAGLKGIVDNKCGRLADLSRQQINCNGIQFDVMTAKGLAIMSASELRPDELLRRADRAMYAAKTRGTQETIPYDRAMENKDQEYKVIESHLRRALTHGEDFHMVYQPIVTARAMKDFRSFEALARWNDPDLGNVSPEKFIDVAETSGLIIRLGWLILDMVCRDIQRLDGCTVGLNVSPLQLMTPGFADLFAARVAENGVNSDQIYIEVTEKIVVRDDVTIAQELTKLRNHGFDLALDDFGTGYSSIGYLTRMPFDVLKIDRSFSNLNGDNKQMHRMVRSIIGLAHSMGLKTVAEGIENEADARSFRDLGCDYLQGYHIGKPAPITHYIDTSENDAPDADAQQLQTQAVWKSVG